MAFFFFSGLEFAFVMRSCCFYGSVYFTCQIGSKGRGLMAVGRGDTLGGSQVSAHDLQPDVMMPSRSHEHPQDCLPSGRQYLFWWELELVLDIPRDIKVPTPVLSKASEPMSGGRQSLRSVFSALSKLVPSGIYQAGETMARDWSHPTPWPWTVLPSLSPRWPRKFYLYGTVGWREAVPNAEINGWGAARGPKGNTRHPCAHSFLKLGNSTLRCTWPQVAKVTGRLDGWTALQGLRLSSTLSSVSSQLMPKVQFQSHAHIFRICFYPSNPLSKYQNMCLFSVSV